MIFELSILALTILAIYGKTYRYNLLIDDEVPRQGYLVVLTTDEGIRPKPEFYEQKRSWLYTFTALGTFALCVFAIYIQWGFWAALLFTVCPLNVCGVAWGTGSYYMATVWFILVANYFANHIGLFGKFLSVGFFWVSLETTVSAFAYPFFAMTFGAWGLPYIMPLLAFLFGKRFRTGLSKRNKLHSDKRVKSGQIDPMRIFIMPKVIAYYICLSLFPSRLGFFHEAPKFLNTKARDRYFYGSIIVIGLFTLWGFGVSWQMTLWYLLFIGLYSQYTTFGMFIAERYTLVANVGLCVLLSLYLPHSWLICLTCLWGYRAYLYTDSFRNNEQLFSQSVRAFPQTCENFNNLGAIYMTRGLWQQALTCFIASIKLDPVPSSNIFINASMCYEYLGQFTTAVMYIDKATQVCANSERNQLEQRRIHLLNQINKLKINKKMLRKAGIL